MELGDIVDLTLRFRGREINYEAANPRHEHEWRVFEDIPLPDDKILLPGVIESCNNYVEHPGVVAGRIERLAGVVGRERVMASTDCGFASFAKLAPVMPDVVWMKLRSLVEGAAIATEQLWGGRKRRCLRPGDGRAHCAT